MKLAAIIRRSSQLEGPNSPDDSLAGTAFRIYLLAALQWPRALARTALSMESCTLCSEWKLWPRSYSYMSRRACPGCTKSRRVAPGLLDIQLVYWNEVAQSLGEKRSEWENREQQRWVRPPIKKHTRGVESLPIPSPYSPYITITSCVDQHLIQDRPMLYAQPSKLGAPF